MNLQIQSGLLGHLFVSAHKQTATNMNIIFDVSGMLFQPFSAKDNPLQGAVCTLKPFIFSTIARLLHDCSSLGHRLFIVSDWTQESLEFLKADPAASRLFNFFDDIILSETSGFKKSDPRIFDHLIAKHRLDPRQCIFIDNQKISLQAAYKVGITKGILCENLNLNKVRQDLEFHGVL